MNQQIAGKEKRFNLWITIVSIVIPIVVALLFSVRLPGVEPLSFSSSCICRNQWPYCRTIAGSPLGN